MTPRALASLHQIQLSFVAEEDRLLLRVSTKDHQELRFWLTRRLVIRLWPLLVEQLASHEQIAAQVDPESRRTVLEFRHEAALTGADFQSPFREDSTEMPLGPEPVLVAKARVRRGEGPSWSLWLLPKAGSGMQLTLTEGMLHSLSKMLAETVAKAEWGIDAPLGTAAERPARLN